MLVNWW